MKQLPAPWCKIHILKNITYKTVLLSLLSVGVSFSVSAKTVIDSDGDGLSDQYEEQIGTEAFLSDTDGDGVKDGIEVGNNLKKPLNSDNDKRIDALDYDDDNDGLPTFLETKVDTDKDGLKNYLDKDSDNDGLTDGIEAGVLNQDKNTDGVDDAFDVSRKGAIDNNGDGIDDNLKLPDYDQDGIPDYLDAKYKNQTTQAPQTIVKNKQAIAEEKQQQVVTEKVGGKESSKIEIEKAKAKPQNKIVVNRYTDSDNDGLLDSQEIILGTNPLKRDSDGDKVSDAIEIGMDINSPQDSDHDKIIDALDNDDDNDGVLTRDEDINQDSTAINDDTDQDGVPNYLDANDDGDNRLTRDEGGVADTDNDGILDYLDKNDGFKDVAPKVANKEKIPSEPEVVVLFDGNISSLPEETTDLAKQAIEDAIAGGSLNEKPEIAVRQLEPKKPKNVVIKETKKEVKRESGFMQWLTSLWQG